MGYNPKNMNLLLYYIRSIELKVIIRWYWKMSSKACWILGA